MRKQQRATPAACARDAWEGDGLGGSPGQEKLLWWDTVSSLDTFSATALEGGQPSRVWGGCAAALLLPPPDKSCQVSLCVALESRASCSGSRSYLTLATQAARKGQSRLINEVLTLITCFEQCCKEVFQQAHTSLPDVRWLAEATPFFPSFAYQNRTLLSMHRK